MTDAVLDAVAREFQTFTLEKGEGEDDPLDLDLYCEDARALWRYAEQVLNQYVRGKTDLVRLAQAKVLLLDRYLDGRAYASKSHRDKLGDKSHICLYATLLAAVGEVRQKQLSLNPPEVLIISPKAEPTPAPYAVLPPAIFVGELKG